MTRVEIPDPSAGYIATGLTLCFIAAPAFAALAFAAAGGGNPYLNEPDSPNGLLLGLAVLAWLIGAITTLLGLHALLEMQYLVGLRILDSWGASEGSSTS